jgi:O-Antigen ligase
MSKKSSRRKKAERNEDLLSARVAKRYLYVIASVGLLVIPLGLSGVPGGFNASYYMTVWLAAILAIGTLWAAYKKAISLQYSPFFIALGIWLAAKLLTTLTSIQPYHSYWGTYRNWSDGFLYALSVSVIGVVLITLRLERHLAVRLIGLLTVEAILFAAIAIGQAVAQGILYQKVRPDSPLQNADYFLSYLLLFLPLILILLVIYARKQRWWRTTLYGLASLIMLTALFVSLPTHLQTILLPAFENGKADTTSGSQDTSSITASNFTQDTSNAARWAEWKYGLQFGLSHPILGTGPSTTTQEFDSAIAHHNINLKGWDDGNVMNRSHNDLIEQFSQEGLIGLAAYLALFAVFITILVKQWHYIEPKSRPYAAGLAADLVFWFGFNQLLFTTVVAGVVMIVWMALLISMTGSARPVTNHASMLIVTSVTLIMAASGIWIGVYYVNDVMVDIAINTNNQLLSQPASSSTNSSWLQDEALTFSAANRIPEEPYYDEMAALTSTYTYSQVSTANQIEQNSQASNALNYARHALSDDPNSPEYLELLGDIQYTVSPVGSKQSRAGLDEINKAISIAPNWVDLYANTADNAAAKKDYVTVHKYLTLGLAAPGMSKQNLEQLRKTEASLPQQ